MQHVKRSLSSQSRRRTVEPILYRCYGQVLLLFCVFFDWFNGSHQRDIYSYWVYIIHLWDTWSLIAYHADEERFLHLYGQPYARLNRADSIYEDATKPKSRFFKICTMLLFCLPSLYYEEFHNVYVDRTVHYSVWRRFITEMKEDWKNSVTPVRVHKLESSYHTE